jgi:hypothetical protein
MRKRKLYFRYGSSFVFREYRGWREKKGFVAGSRFARMLWGEYPAMDRLGCLIVRTYFCIAWAMYDLPPV